jgi:membrane-bound hydrogenase subunit beta
MSDIEIVESLKKDLGAKALEVTNPDRRRVFLKIAAADLVPAVTLLRDKYDCAYLATITGLDKGESFELLYHFASPVVSLTVRTSIPRTEPRLPSICAVIPGAIFYEREIQEMFGITMEGIPDTRRLNLPDDWPDGQFPLRKDWKFERPVEVIPGGKS